MSLSRVFKESKNFHPEEILPRADSKGSSWPAPARPKHAFIESPQEKSTGGPGFRQEQLLPSSSKTPSATTAIPASSTSALQTDVETAAEVQLETSPPRPQSVAGIDQETVDGMVDESYQQGVEEGLRRAEADFGSATVALLEVCQQLDRIRETLLKNSFGEMQDLAISVAEKIIRSSVREQDATILATVEEAIHSAVKSDEFYIYVNPEDFEIVQEKSADFIAGVNGLNNLVMKKDPEIERGGCKVESDYCVVDATIGSQFELIREKIKNRLLVI